MKTSEKGFDLIKRFEGYKRRAYRCPAGVWTIGYGHTKGVAMGNITNRQEAEDFLKQDVAVMEAFLNRKDYGFSQCQFDALVAFGFNVGLGNLRSSTLWRRVRANVDDVRIGKEFGRWVHSDGKRLKGLIRRREAERVMYFNEK